MPDNRKLRVFLCHSSQDKSVVRELYQRLLAEGWIDPWLDEEKLLPGQDWDMEIEKAVEAAEAVIVFLSNNSVTKSGYIQKELRKALNMADEKPEGEIFVIPVRLDDCQLLHRLKRWQYVDYFSKNNAVNYSRILQSLEYKATTLGVRINELKKQKDAEEQIRKEISDKHLVEIMLENDRLEVAVQIISLVSKSLEFHEVVERALQATVSYMSTKERPVFGTLQRLDSKMKELVDVAGVGYGKERVDIRVPLGEGATGWVAQTGSVLLIEDLTDPQWEEVYIDAMASHMRSLLAVPLLREGKVWGVLNVESLDPKAFDKKDQRLLETIADQIMIALRNAEEHTRLIEKLKLENELQISKEIQESMAPGELPNFAGFDFGAQIIPARAVGGDLFDFIRLGRGSIGIFIGDVVDKGVPASIFMASTRGFVRAMATSELSPREVLLTVNQNMYEMNTADMFVTMIYGVLKRDRTFTYAQGGYGIPLLFDSKGRRQELAKESGQALGIWPSSKIRIEEKTIKIPPMGTLLLYSDGVIEARNDGDKEFGIVGLEDLVLKNPRITSRRLCKLILQALDEYRGSVPQYDDAALVVLRAKK